MSNSAATQPVAIIAGSVASNAFRGASRVWFTRRTVFAGLLGSL